MSWPLRIATLSKGVGALSEGVRDLVLRNRATNQPLTSRATGQYLTSRSA